MHVNESWGGVVFVMDIERHNYRQIELLNQRGGRTLSVVDLILAGTLDVPMAAYALRAVDEGASLLTAARPGGAGKTTLMASILHLLPPDVPIVTVEHPQYAADALSQDSDGPKCYLVHEIGDGHWYGYLWGPAVGQYVSLVGGPRRIASCLHADTLDELTGILCSPPLGVSRKALGRVGLILFMHVDRSRAGYRRRVAAFYEADGQGGHRLVFAWDEPSDTFLATAALGDPEGLAPYEAFIRQLLDRDECNATLVRRRVLEFYERRQSRGGGRR
jgi:hypothetical protein